MSATLPPSVELLDPAEGRRGRVLLAVELLMALLGEMLQGLRARMPDGVLGLVTAYGRVVKALALAIALEERILSGWFGEDFERFRRREEEEVAEAPGNAEEKVEKQEDLEVRVEREVVFDRPDPDWCRRSDDRFWRRPVEEIFADICKGLKLRKDLAASFDEEFRVTRRLSEVEALAGCAGEVLAVAMVEARNALLMSSAARAGVGAGCVGRPAGGQAPPA